MGQARLERQWRVHTRPMAAPHTPCERAQRGARPGTVLRPAFPVTPHVYAVRGAMSWLDLCPRASPRGRRWIALVVPLVLVGYLVLVPRSGPPPEASPVFNSSVRSGGGGDPKAKPRMVYIGADSAYVVAYQCHEDGSLEEVQRLENAPNPRSLKVGGQGISTEWVAVHPRKPLLYAMTSFWDADNAQLVTYRIDKATGRLTRIGACDTGGMQAAHATFSRTGKFLLVAHYVSGHVSIFDTEKSDRIARASAVIELPGPRDPQNYGRFGVETPLAHGVTVAPSGRYFTVCDAGQDRLWTFAFDERTGAARLVQELAAFSTLPYHGLAQSVIMTRVLGGKSRPRHMAYHPNGRFAYVLHEARNAVCWHRHDDATGRIGAEVLGQVSTLSAAHRRSWFIGLAINAAAEVAVTPDGRYLFASNRGLRLKGGAAENSVAVFALRDDGAAVPVQHLPAESNPRHFLRLGDDSLLVGLAGRTRQRIARYAPRDALGGEAFTREWEPKEATEIGQAVLCIAVWGFGV